MTVPVPRPAWLDPWLTWRHKYLGLRRDLRPTSAPTVIPAWAWAEYKRVYPPPSVFAGRGCLTAHDPRLLVNWGIVDLFSWIALKGDGGDHATVSDAAALRAAGAKRIFLWYANDEPLTLVPADVGATALICQAEGPEQMTEGKLRAAWTPSIPRALITNNYMSTINPSDWPVVLAESYWNVVEAASPGSCAQDSLNRGAKVAYPCFGIGTWAEAFRTVALSSYVAAWGPTDWSIYLGEYLDAADVAYLKGLPR